MVMDLVKRNRELEALTRKLLEENNSLKNEAESLEKDKKSSELRIGYLENQKEILEHKVKSLLMRIFGRRSERFADYPGQLDFFKSEILKEATSDQVEASGSPSEEAPDYEEYTVKRRKKKQNGRRPLPKDLPRERVVHDPSPEDRICRCGKQKVRIGEKVTEELEFIPAQFKIVEHACSSFKCVDCDGEFVTGSLPARPIDKGRPGPGLLAHVAVSKYADHLPLYRQEKIFARYGVDLHRTTLCDWIAATADLVEPIAREVKRQILESRLVQGDETPVQVQTEEKKGKTHRAYLYAYCIPWAEVAFDFQMNRSRDGPLSFFSGYRGYLQTDGYDGYNATIRTGRVTRIGCLSHVRRKFKDALNEAPDETGLILVSIQKLYHIERRLKEEGASPEEKVSVRKREAQPILKDLEGYLRTLREVVLPQSLLGKAVDYALGQWAAILRYLEVGEAEIDNNSCENAIRTVAIGRKNWLYCGSPEGGRRAAILYTLIVSAKRLGIDPWAYLRDIIDRVSTHPASRIRELTPRGWLEALKEAENPSPAPSL